MTVNQWRLLEILDRWSGHGTIEVESQYGEYEPDTDDENDQDSEGGSKDERIETHAGTVEII